MLSRSENRGLLCRRIGVVAAAIGWLMAIGTSCGTAGGEEAAGSLEPAERQASEVTVQVDQRYSSAPGKAGLCDVYLPSQPPPTNGYPLVMVIHGGGWATGDKFVLQGYSRMLAQHGFAVVTINYRLAPRSKFPDQVDDVREALIWAKQNARRFSIDLGHVGLCGYSAGGHLSALVGCLGDEPASVRVTASHWQPDDPRWDQLPKIHAICIGGPPCDFQTLPIDNKSMAYFLGGSRREKPLVYRAASPIAHVSANDPPTQIIHGESDLLVSIDGSRRMHQAQKTAGVDSRLRVIAKQGHALTFLNPETSSTMVKFFEEKLK